MAAGRQALPRVQGFNCNLTSGSCGLMKDVTLECHPSNRHSTGLTHCGGTVAVTTPCASTVTVTSALTSSTGSHSTGAVVSKSAYHCCRSSVSQAFRSMPSSRSTTQSRRTSVRCVIVLYNASISCSLRSKNRLEFSIAKIVFPQNYDGIGHHATPSPSSIVKKMDYSKKKEKQRQQSENYFVSLSVGKCAI